MSGASRPGGLGRWCQANRGQGDDKVGGGKMCFWESKKVGGERGRQEEDRGREGREKEHNPSAARGRLAPGAVFAFPLNDVKDLGTMRGSEPKGQV